MWRFFSPLACHVLQDLSSSLEELDRVSVRVLELDLFPARSNFHLISKMKTCFLQSLNPGWKLCDLKHNSVPSTGLLRMAVRHRS